MGIGDAQPFEQALDAAILAPAAVQCVEDDIGAVVPQARGKVGAGIKLDHLAPCLTQCRGTFATR